MNHHQPKITPKSYGLKGQLGALARASNYDPDDVSILKLGRAVDDLDGAFVIIKGHDNVMAFRKWAAAEGLFDPKRDSGLRDALQKHNKKGTS